jgi:2,4-dienoyl-CoA reductase-like NADH-dependent reductase (Old Yellow Enzyme family)
MTSTRRTHDPLRIGALSTPNRLWLAPMTNQQSNADGTLHDDELRWLEARAAGGFGVIESCATHVTTDGQGWSGELGIWGDHTLDGWRRLADAMHAHGAALFAQIFHAGHRAARDVPDADPWSAVAGSERDRTWRGGTQDDIARVIDAFAAGARRAHAAGLDGVELHGAHGYLLCQFLSGTQNTRDDGWGGNLAGRARLIREATQAVRAAVPRDFVVGVRLSPEDFGATTGLDLDESVQVAQWLVDDGCDFVHISLWDSFVNTKKYPDRHALEVFRPALASHVPLVVAGGVWTPAQAQSLLDLGADAIALGRSAIANPTWPRDARDPTWEPKRTPLTADELAARALSPGFIDYMRRWKGFVAD